MRRSRTAGLVRAALAASLVAISALLIVPLGPVPVTLQVLAIAAIVLLLSPSESLAALATYVGLGAIGLPVFSGGSGGIGVILGPTGGFLLGFLLGAPLGSFVRTRLSFRHGGCRLAADLLGIAVLLAVSYAAGLAWFATVTGVDAATAFTIAVAPFLFADAGKAVVAVLVARAVRRAGGGALGSEATT
ncbi:MAG: biotin transporter BioY [Coriobacteriia bacterium]|nr:biotin transporter BioY [Coriobacteriia bacterium]